jgi:hypothetical protein
MNYEKRDVVIPVVAVWMQNGICTGGIGEV